MSRPDPRRRPAQGSWIGQPAVGGAAEKKTKQIRLDWLDGVKGISILWIVFFHFFVAYHQDGRFPWPLRPDYFSSYLRGCAPESPGETARCLVSASLAAAVQLGFHAVAVFLLLSGFGLSYSLTKTDGPPSGWPAWYRSRVVRLFPMYWVAHFVYLISPFQARPEPIDYRFLLSFLGDRVVPINTLFYYFNPALWYFGLLLQLYLVFPALFLLLQRVGIVRFLILAGAATFGARSLLLLVTPVQGEWVQGGFFLCRLWEFAVGMAAGVLWRKWPAEMEARVFSLAGLAAGSVIYTLGLYSYVALWSYVFTDALTGTGLAIIIAHVARGLDRIWPLGRAAAAVGVYSYGLYLLHQPYVVYLGALANPLSTLAFVGTAFAAMTVITLGAMALEHMVNGLTNRLLR